MAAFFFLLLCLRYAQQKRFIFVFFFPVRGCGRFCCCFAVFHCCSIPSLPEVYAVLSSLPLPFTSNCSLHFHCCHFLVPSALPFCLRVVTFFFLLWFHTPFSSHHRSITKCVSQLTQTFPPPLLADLSNHADPCCLGCSGCRCPRAEPPSPQHS